LSRPSWRTADVRFGSQAEKLRLAIGKALRARLSMTVFRRCVLVGLLTLGAGMLVRFVL